MATSQLKRCPFLSLPPELIDMILSYCFPPLPSRHVGHLKSSKSVLLVCRKLNDMALPKLYEHVALWNRRDFTSFLQCISTRTDRAVLVKRLDARRAPDYLKSPSGLALCTNLTELRLHERPMYLLLEQLPWEFNLFPKLKNCKKCRLPPGMSKG
jgi:hypothetical protein